MRYFKLFILTLAALATMSACSRGPETPDVSFAYSTYSYTEGYGSCYVAVYQMESPYEFPVVVTLQGKVTAGKNNLGESYKWTDIIDFEIEANEEEVYTVRSIDDTTFEISGVLVTYSEYNKKIYFKSLVNDYLQKESIEMEFKIIAAEGSNIGTSDTTTVYIVDDEDAPLIKTGYYKTDYEVLGGVENSKAGSFYLRLYKTDKYEYVASGWFGLTRPRLVGVFDPEAQTLTFDGTDYDHLQWFDDEEEAENRINAFNNDTLYGYKAEGGITTQILRFHGGRGGKGPIVISTDKIEENASGFLVECTSECGFEIWDFDAEKNKATYRAGTWDGMIKSTSMTHSSTNYEVSTQSRGSVESAPVPFSQWTLSDINE